MHPEWLEPGFQWLPEEPVTLHSPVLRNKLKTSGMATGHQAFGFPADPVASAGTVGTSLLKGVPSIGLAAPLPTRFSKATF